MLKVLNGQVKPH